LKTFAILIIIVLVISGVGVVLFKTGAIDLGKSVKLEVKNSSDTALTFKVIALDQERYDKTIAGASSASWIQTYNLPIHNLAVIDLPSDTIAFVVIEPQEFLVGENTGAGGPSAADIAGKLMPGDVVQINFTSQYSQELPVHIVRA
jgi:hypothetical protein